MKLKRRFDIVLFYLITVIQFLLFSTCNKNSLPIVVTNDVTGITQTTAVTGGNITDDGGAEITHRGVYWGTRPAPEFDGNARRTLDGSGKGIFSSHLAGLELNTTYYVKAYDTNSEGTSFGEEVSFNTAPGLIGTVSTVQVTHITESAAFTGGVPMYTGGAGVEIIAKGVCWSTSPNPMVDDNKTTDGSGSAAYVSHITGLETNTTYYVRAYVTNEAGTGYGEMLSFTPPEDLSQVLFNPEKTYGSVSDIDGNVYKTVQIGNQIWMAENLRTTRLNDGTWLGDFLINIIYESYIAVVGNYYRWYYVQTGKLCPSGWHVPSQEEVDTLLIHLGGSAVAGGKLKETGTLHWSNPNTGASNETGFSAIPGGYFDNPYGYMPATIHEMGTTGIWWLSTPSPYDCCSMAFILSHSDQELSLNEMNIYIYLPVRCVRDE